MSHVFVQPGGKMCLLNQLEGGLEVGLMILFLREITVSDSLGPSSDRYWGGSVR